MKILKKLREIKQIVTLLNAPKPKISKEDQLLSNMIDKEMLDILNPFVGAIRNLVRNEKADKIKKIDIENLLANYDIKQKQIHERYPTIFGPFYSNK